MLHCGSWKGKSSQPIYNTDIDLIPSRFLCFPVSVDSLFGFRITNGGHLTVRQPTRNFGLTSSQWSYWYRDLLNFNSNSSNRLFSSSALMKSLWTWKSFSSICLVASSQSGENSKFGEILRVSAGVEHVLLEWEQVALRGIARFKTTRILTR